MREIRCRQRRNRVVAAGVLATTVATTSAHAGGVFLYEMATPDLGTASAGRAAAADNAATAFGNPAGMTRLDQSQMLVGIQPGYGITHFDKDNETTVSGGNGGNALGFIPGIGGYFVYSATPDLKFGALAGVRLRPLRALPEQLVRTLYACRRRSSPSALFRWRRIGSIGGYRSAPRTNHLRPAELEDRDQRCIRRRQCQHRRLQQRRRLWRPSRHPHRAGRGHALRRYLYVPGETAISRKSPRPTTSGRC